MIEEVRKKGNWDMKYEWSENSLSLLISAI
jgi:hypothetical protein